jgi:hypothetical protein
MAKKNKETSYWPHMILGFLIVGITLSYWTVKSASSVPVQESNEYMMKYQKADMNINDILNKKARFDQSFRIEIIGAKEANVELENSKRGKEERSILLNKGENSFTYRVSDRHDQAKSDANVTFLLTRPHTIKDDVLVEDVQVRDGNYVIEDINITKPGRYLLQLKVVVDKDTVGYSELPAYLKP